MRLIGETEARVCGPHCRVCAVLRKAVPRAVADVGIHAVSLEQLAEAAELHLPVARTHARDDVLGLLGSAYLTSAGGLQAGFVRAFRHADTPRDGLERSVRWLLGTLAEDPDRALFCYVEILNGVRPLVSLREQIRRQSVGVWAVHYQSSHPGEWLPRSHFELVNAAVINLIATRARSGRTDELPEMADAVMAILEPGAAHLRLN